VSLRLRECSLLLFFAADPNDSTQVLDDTRYLGLVVCRGTAVMTICPPGELIANPFAAADEGAAQ
jgi:hypothetical protein